jgi:hypothetical protein
MIKRENLIEDDKLIFASTQDIEPLLNDIKAIKDITNGKSDSGDMYHVGTIPAIIVEKYCNEVGISFHDFIIDNTHIKRIVNDPDFARFRVWEGKL